MWLGRQSQPPPCLRLSHSLPGSLLDEHLQICLWKGISE